VVFEFFLPSLVDFADMFLLALAWELEYQWQESLFICSFMIFIICFWSLCI
jgi:hypothetical protein